MTGRKAQVKRCPFNSAPAAAAELNAVSYFLQVIILVIRIIRVIFLVIRIIHVSRINSFIILVIVTVSILILFCVTSIIRRSWCNISSKFLLIVEGIIVCCTGSQYQCSLSVAVAVAIAAVLQ